MAAPLVDPQLAAWQAGDPGTLPATPPGTVPGTVPAATVTPTAGQIRAGMEIAAAFLVLRHLISQRLSRRPADGSETEQAHAEWLAHTPIWLRLALPPIRAAMTLDAPTVVTQADLEQAAVDYTTRLGDYLDDSSAQALAEGLARQLGNKWDRQLAWQRATAGYGLDPRRMAAWIAGVQRAAELNPVDPIPAASRAQLDAMLLQRADRLGADEAGRAAQTGKALAWLVGHQAGMFPAGTVKEWDCRLENTCGTCGPLHRQQQPPDQPFRLPDGTAVWSPTLHPGCQCTTHLLPPDRIGKRYDPAEARDWRGQWAAEEEPEPEPAATTGGQQRPAVTLGRPPVSLGPSVSLRPPAPAPAPPVPAPTRPPVVLAAQAPVVLGSAPAQAPAVEPAPVPAVEPEPAAAPAAGRAPRQAITALVLDDVVNHIQLGPGTRALTSPSWRELKADAQVKFGVPPPAVINTEAWTPQQWRARRNIPASGPPAGPDERRALEPQSFRYKDLPPLELFEEDEQYWKETEPLRRQERHELDRHPERVDQILSGADPDQVKMIYDLAGVDWRRALGARGGLTDGIREAMEQRANGDNPQLASAYLDYVAYLQPDWIGTNEGFELSTEDYDALVAADPDYPPVQQLIVFDGYAPGDGPTAVKGDYEVDHVDYSSNEAKGSGTAGFRFIHVKPDKESYPELRKRRDAFGVVHLDQPT